MTDTSHDRHDEAATGPTQELLEVRQQLEQVRRELRAAETRAERPDPWDPKVWVSRARRIQGMGGRALRRMRRQAQGPVAVEPVSSTAPSAPASSTVTAG